MKNIKIRLVAEDLQKVNAFCKSKGLSTNLYVRYGLADFVRSCGKITIEPYAKEKECQGEISVNVSDALYEPLKRHGNMAGKVARHIMLTRLHADELRGDFVLVFNAEISKLMETDF